MRNVRCAALPRAAHRGSSPYQVGLAALTVLAVTSLVFSCVRYGLLATPDMGVTGPGSYGSTFSWFVDRTSAALPQPTVYSVPMWVYRTVMFAWALWIALALARWLRFAWYGQVLGLPHLYTYGTLAFFDCGGVRLFLSQVDSDAPAESVIYLRVADIQKAYEELRARGVDFTNGPHMIHRHADGTEEWMAFFKDPEGRPLAIMSQVK